LGTRQDLPRQNSERSDGSRDIAGLWSRIALHYWNLPTNYNSYSILWATRTDSSSLTISPRVVFGERSKLVGCGTTSQKMQNRKNSQTSLCLMVSSESEESDACPLALIHSCNIYSPPINHGVSVNHEKRSKSRINTFRQLFCAHKSSIVVSTAFKVHLKPHTEI
jgi:hypothetical protein